MEFHPVSSIFPLMTGAAFDELVADIKANGLQVAIWLHEGQIIDGRNRYNACQKAGRMPVFRDWDGVGDLVKFVVSLNLRRRHLNESQRAMIAAKLATWERGLTKAKATASQHGQICPSSQEKMTTGEAASLLNVGEGSVKSAKRVRREAAPAVVAAVEAGEVSVHLAERVIGLPKSDQPTALAREKLRKGKRTARNSAPKFSTNPTGYTMAGSKDDPTIKVAINTAAPAQAAVSLVAALETEFLEQLVEELTGILNRRRAAQSRGMGPARKD